MSSSGWICLFFVTISTSYGTCTVCSGLFIDADLTFVYTPESDKSFAVDTGFPYVHVVMADNFYTPLRHVVFNQSIFSAMDINRHLNHLIKFEYPETKKFSRPIVLSLNFVASARLDKNCENSIFSFVTAFRPELLFVKAEDRKDFYCLQRHPRFLVTGKLVLFHTNSLFVPCLTCDRVVLSKLGKLSLPGIREGWDAQNRDLHKYFTYLNMPVKGSCALLQDGLSNLKDFAFCPVATIAERFNVTLLEHRHGDMLQGNKNFGLALVEWYGYNTALEFICYGFDLQYINFITITKPPSPAGGVTIFLSPFDMQTWIHGHGYMDTWKHGLFWPVLF